MSTSFVPDKVQFYAGNVTSITVRLYDRGTSSYFNASAVVSAELLNAQGVLVPGSNASMSFVVGSIGDFTINIGGADFQPTPGSGYKLHIIATQGDARGEWHIPGEVPQERTR